MLANMASTLDHVSGGRPELGIGAGRTAAHWAQHWSLVGGAGLALTGRPGPE